MDVDIGSTLDAISSSDSDAESEHIPDEGFLPHPDQVPYFLLSGQWVSCLQEMSKDLYERLGMSLGYQVMQVILDTRPIEVTQCSLNRAFVEHHELGLAYLALFPHRLKYYTMFTGRKWKRNSPYTLLPQLAHGHPKVSASNPSGITSCATHYAAMHKTRFIDLGMGCGTYIRNIPTDLRWCGGYEINANPLQLQQTLTNILRHRPDFHFIPVSFEPPCMLPEGASTLFSWRPGSYNIPLIQGTSNITAFFKGAAFVNVQSQGMRMHDSNQSIAFYANFDSPPLPTWTVARRPQTPPPALSLLDALGSFDIVAKLNTDTRKLRACLSSMGADPSSIRTEADARMYIQSMGKPAFAKWFVRHGKWKFVREVVLANCEMDMRMIFSCGVPQAECRNRLLQEITILHG